MSPEHALFPARQVVAITGAATIMAFVDAMIVNVAFRTTGELRAR